MPVKKAREYAVQYRAAPDNKKLGEAAVILVSFLREAAELIAARKANCASAAFAALNEQELKWRKFNTLIKGDYAFAFQLAVRATLPQVYRAWRENSHHVVPPGAGEEIRDSSLIAGAAAIAFNRK